MEFSMDLNALNNLRDLTEKYNAQLLPVIKDKKIEDIKKVYDEGYREFGENRLEQLLNHQEKLEDARFHFIAPLQSRKIKKILENSISIHTVSRMKEAKLINDNYSNQNIYLQINIDDDPNKNGIRVGEIDLFLNIFDELNYFPVGIMCIPNIEVDSKLAFSKMQNVNEKIKKNYKDYNGQLSMGMSGDYEIALDYGATLIRIGSKIFN
jgi:hypothetical protein|tara:strand:+ start:746 stop:1372 length:627 start_codon:yes stop_codon:yes gene_type:complete